MTPAETFLASLIASLQGPEDKIDRNEFNEIARSSSVRRLSEARVLDNTLHAYHGSPNDIRPLDALLKWPTDDQIATKQILTDEEFEKASILGNPFFYPYIRGLADEMSETATRALGSRVSFATIGILPIPTPNAMAMIVPETGEPVIAFQAGMSVFLNKILKIMIKTDVRLPIDEFET